MEAEFQILSAATVPATYIWDKGTPLSGANIVTAYTTNSYASGYSPGLKVKFINLSTPDPDFQNVTYTWNFGDYYNDTTNILTVSNTDPVEHTYIMPGNYTVTLTINQSRTVTTLNNATQLCRGKFGINWYWDRHLGSFANSMTWDKVMCVPPLTAEPKRPRWWDDDTSCLEKYCKLWSWGQVSTQGANPVGWIETKTFNDYEKEWGFEPNDTPCIVPNAVFLETLDSKSKTKIIQNAIKVVEIPPTAYLQSTNISTTPRQVRIEFSAYKCITGSFPIDRIDWDFGDGSPILTVSRYSTEINNNIVRNVPSYYVNDPTDVRNYNVRHTYSITNFYPLFYPSLTCYSASTNTSRSGSLRVGPLQFPNIPEPITLLKSRNTEYGNIHTFYIDKNITFLTTGSAAATTLTRNITRPQNSIRDSFYLPQPLYNGNTGLSYTALL